MIPLRDNNPTRTFPLITVLLILVNVWAYLTISPQMQREFEMIPREVVTGHQWVGFEQAAGNGQTHFIPASPDVVATAPINSNTTLRIPPSPVSPWATIFTSMFLHANLLHIGGNMLFLWIFGNNVEDAFGKLRYLLFYLGCGLIAALAQIAISPESLIPTLGASGAIAGVLGAYIVMYPKARVLTLITALFIWFLRDISALWVIGLWIALQVFEGVMGLGGMETGGVAYFAHIGGFFAGMVVTIMMGGRALGAKQIRLSGYRRA